MGMSDMFGLDTNAGSSELDAAIQQLKALGVPNASQLTLPELQKYVIAGVLTPTQYQAISENPDAYKDAFAGAQDTTGRTAQQSALQQLGTVVQNGGSSPINQANLDNNINQTNQAMQAARSGITNDAQQRGVSGGGLEFISKLMNEQSSADTANRGAVQAGANNAQLALQALSQQGSLGGQIQGQSDSNANAQAQAAAQIAQYNSQLQSAANQYNTNAANQAQATNMAQAQSTGDLNTQNANLRTQYNAQIPQQMFQDNLQKANALTSAYGAKAGLESQQAGQQNAFTGNLLGTAGTVIGGMYGGPMGAAAGNAVGKKAAEATIKKDNGYAQGGQVMAEQPQPGLRAGGDVQRGQPQQPQGGGRSNGGIPKEALMALAGVMAAYPILKYSFGGGAPEQTTLQQDMGQQASPMVDDPMNMAHGGMCYAQGGEVHDHNLCMEAGGPVPGDDSQMPMGHDDESQDVVDAHLSPNEIVLPRSVAQAPDAPQAAAQFVGNIKGQDSGMQGNGGSFADVLAQLEANGLELRLTSKGA